MKPIVCHGQVIIRTVVVGMCFFVCTAFSLAASADDASADIPLIHQALYDSASSGSAASQYELGVMFEYGRGVEQDDAKAVFWYEKSAAQFFTDALYRLAILSDNGWGTPSDKEQALGLYTAAAERGHVLAQHDLAIMYFQGADAPKSVMQAYKWLKIAVASGEPLMEKHLRMVAESMSADEIGVAEYLAEEWIEQSDQ